LTSVRGAMRRRSGLETASQNAQCLASVVREHFRNRQVPSHSRLVIFFERVFSASLRRDEARYVRCSIAVLDPGRTEPDAPGLVRFDHWQVTRLSPPILMSVESLARLSQAFTPTSGALAVWFNDGEWLIWGCVDQEYLVRDFREYAGNQFYRRAGQFQVEIDDVGCLSVYHDSVLLAQQKRDQVIRRFQDVVHNGIIAKLLQPYLDIHESAVISVLKNEPRSADDEEPIGVPIDFVEHLLHRSRDDWTAALCRVLLEVRQRGHGGAILLLPRMRSAGLKVGYRIDYRRLAEALSERGAVRVLETCYGVYSTHSKTASFPEGLAESLNQARRRAKDARSAETGAVRFIGSLSGVDGLVVLVGGLVVAGFGVEISTKRDPPRVHRVLDEEGAETEPLDPQTFGTRHRSMMRYCFANANSIGFVVSQDGEVRAVTRVKDSVLFWPNVTLEGDAVGEDHVHCPECSALAELIPMPDNII
jgi:hypothetical protein